MTKTTTQPTALATLLDREIRERLASDRWYRNWRRTYMHAAWIPDGVTRFADLERENRVILRALLRLRRQAQRVAAAQPDPLDVARWEADRRPRLVHA